MLRVGLSGGIGSGKSTVSAHLAELGAVVIDADAVAREVVEPGTPGLAAIRARFGEDVIGADGRLDRPALGAIVFDDAAARRDLEQITHPRIRERSVQRMAGAPDDAVVVHDIPLLVEMGLAGDYALTVIVDVDAGERERRLVELRGMEAGAARARITAQADDRQRSAAADVLLDNRGTLEQLRGRVDDLWRDRVVPFEAALREGRVTQDTDQVCLVPPDPDWPERADRLLGRLRAAFEESLGQQSLLRAEHIGSTSVPGLVAEDVIDLQLVVADPEVCDHPAVVEALRQRGFVVPEGSWSDRAHGARTGPQSDSAGPERRLGTADPALVVHVHLRGEDSPAWSLALMFRDWLRAEPSERRRYADVTAAVAARHPLRVDYAQATEPWVESALARAGQWARRTGWAPGPSRAAARP